MKIKTKMNSIKEKKLQLENEIIARLEKEWILWFLVKEVKESLEYLNFYKIRNVHENIDLLLADLINIQNSYIKSLKE